MRVLQLEGISGGLDAQKSVQRGADRPGTQRAGGRRRDSGALPRHGISEQTFYRWKQKYGGLDGSEAKRLKALEEEDARLKRLVAEQALDNQMLKELLRKNW